MKDKRLIIPFLSPGIVIIVVFILIPLAMAIKMSFYEMQSFVSVPKFAGLHNYIRIFADPEFWHALGIGFFYCIVTIIFQVVLGIAFALVLNESFRGKAFIRGLTLLPYILPTVVVALTWQWMMDGTIGVLTLGAFKLGLGQINWLETPRMAMFTVVLVSVWTWTPFVTTCFLAALQTIPIDLLDAALVDGTSARQRFIYITIPILKPILAIIILLRGIWMFNKFDVIWLLTRGGPMNATTHLPILTYKKVFQTYDIGGGTAVATVSFLILVVVVTIYQKLLVKD